LIAPASNAWTTSIAVGVAPSQGAIARAASRVYVTNTGSSTVSAIDTSIQDVVATIAVGDRPSGIAVSPAGDRVYVLDAAGSVSVIDTGTDAIVASVVVGGTDGTIAVTPDGARVYVASGKVSVIDTSTNAVIASFFPEQVAVPDVFNFAVGVAIAPDGTRAFVTVNTYLYNGPKFAATGGIAVVDTATNAVAPTTNPLSRTGANRL